MYRDIFFGGIGGFVLFFHHLWVFDDIFQNEFWLDLCLENCESSILMRMSPLHWNHGFVELELGCNNWTVSRLY